MKKYVPAFIFLLLLSATGCKTSEKQEKETSQSTVPATIQKQTVHFNAADGLPVTADYYPAKEADAPLIILFHQARFSRGEYLEIAPKLNAMGYRCLAIDQRSGKEANGIENETHKEALKRDLPTKYPDAIPDLEAAIAYAQNELKAKNPIIWGSSYSAALTFYLGSKHAGKLKAILAFSPGEYFEIGAKSLASFAQDITCPVFITSAKDERDNWQAIYEAVPSEKHFFLPETAGKHGSKALWAKHEGHEAYWEAVEAFLNGLK